MIMNFTCTPEMKQWRRNISQLTAICALRKTGISAENNADIIDHKVSLSGHSFLPNDSDFGVLEMGLRKNNLMYVPRDFYETIKTCRKSNKFIFTKMKREDFFSTTPLDEAIHRRLKNTSGEPVNWLRRCCM